MVASLATAHAVGMLDSITPETDLELFARSVELDAGNEGKDLTSLWWFRRELVAEQRGGMGAEGEVLTSDDGLRVWLVWRRGGARRELIERDADVVREALAAHPIFAQARAVEARILRAAKAP
jgi:hypothetical protein